MGSGKAASVRLFEWTNVRFAAFQRHNGSDFTFLQCSGGRGCAKQGGEYDLFSGPPPQSWKCDLDAPKHQSSIAETSAILKRLVLPYRGRTMLYYTAVTGNRTILDESFTSAIRSLAVWGITGFLETLTGVRGPIGWSGRGDGLQWISDHGARELRELNIKLERATACPSGAFDAVLSPAAAAVLLHEAIGHVAEAAHLSTGQRAFVPKRIASEYVSAYDHALETGGPAHYESDDENVKCLGPTHLVHQGILIRQLHSYGSAARTGTLPTANGRLSCVWKPVLPRFSNLICVPGESTEEQLVDAIHNGIYLIRLANGIYNGADVEADIVLAEQIRNGKRTGQYMTGGQIKEHAGLLLRVTGLANNSTFYNNALCGKDGQILFDVGTASPALLIRQLRVVA
ncbi:MAG: hypothetical protein LAO78_11620 [Acidobacteriia bacterium]|nr:hypothetical protein [Terriglobia bacterium]